MEEVVAVRRRCSSSGRHCRLGLWAIAAMGAVHAIEARKSTEQGPTNGDSYAALVLIVAVLLFCIGGVVWCLYIESRPEIHVLRSWMWGLLACNLCVELSICNSYFAWWVVPTMVFIALWGSLDAVLRFPIMHSLTSFFTLKQLMLLVAKSVCYVLGVNSYRRHSGGVLWVCVMILLNVIGLPIMYMLAFPYDFENADEVASASDADIVVKVMYMVANPKGRLECRFMLRRWAMDAGQLFAGRYPVLAEAICRQAPSYTGCLRKRGRSI